MSHDQIAVWNIFEVSFAGPSAGNPFIDVSVEAVFSLNSREIRVPGFYDGDGIYEYPEGSDVDCGS